MNFLDCGCCINDNGTRTWCPSCESGTLSPAPANILCLEKEIDDLKIILQASENNGLKWLKERDLAIHQRDEARQWVLKLQNTTQTLTCVYCGKEYPPGTPSHGAEVLTEHIRICNEHPMRSLEKKCEALEGEVKKLLSEKASLEKELAQYQTKSARQTSQPVSTEPNQDWD